MNARQFSLQNGRDQQVGETLYRGSPPEFVMVLSDPDNPYSQRVAKKTVKGVPFVKVA